MAAAEPDKHVLREKPATGRATVELLWVSATDA
jgi:hypothetical protein